MPLILAGDFNVNFADESALPLITFFKDKFQLEMNNDAQQSTTKYGTTLDAVFSRFLYKINPKNYIFRDINYFVKMPVSLLVST